MTRVSDVARVRILMADYVSVDQAGKLNIVGGGVSGVLRLLGSPQAPIWFLVSVSVPPDLYGAECDVLISLEDRHGQPVADSADADEGERPFQIRRPARFPEPLASAPWDLPKDYLWSSAHLIGLFPAGPPVKNDGAYVWRVTVNGETREDWTERFVVVSQPAPEPPL